MSMYRCSRCDGFVPEASSGCPNCRSSRAWWSVPLAMAGAGLSVVTLSACYGPACVTDAKTTFPDGSTLQNCYQDFDCRVPLPDGGAREQDPDWLYLCNVSPQPGPDAGVDGGTDGGTDAGK
jgi:hypothetical protein